MVLHLCFRLALETQENATLVFEQSVVLKLHSNPLLVYWDRPFNKCP
jgi:hypothetical protein